MKLLLAEDTIDLNRVLTVALQHEGYAVDSAYDGEQALELVRKNGYDAMILDIMMPKKDGLTVLKELREHNIVCPVLLLTAKAEIDDRVAGLDAGADDYLTKPFSMKELLARVRAMTRRKTEYTAKKLQYGDFALNDENFELSCENAVRLSVKEFELMQALIVNQNVDVTTDYLLEHVWDADPDAGADTVWLYVSYLRGKLSSIASKVQILGEKGGSFRLQSA